MAVSLLPDRTWALVCVTKLNLSPLTHHTAKPILGHWVAVKESTTFNTFMQNTKLMHKSTKLMLMTELPVGFSR